MRVEPGEEIVNLDPLVVARLQGRLGASIEEQTRHVTRRSAAQQLTVLGSLVEPKEERTNLIVHLVLHGERAKSALL